MITDDDLEQQLRRLGQKITPTPSLVEAVRQRIDAEGQHPICDPRFRTIKRIGRIFAFAAAAAVLVLVINYWPANFRTGLAWADVVHQLRSARTIYFHAVEGKGTHPSDISDYYLKSPGLARCDRSLEQGTSTTIINGRTQITFNSFTKLYLIEPSPNQGSDTFADPHNRIEALLNICGLSGTQEINKDTTPTVPAGGGNVRLSLVGVEARDGRKLRKYAMESLINGQYQKSGYFLWFDPEDNQLTRLTVENDEGEYAAATVQLNVEISDAMFALTPPPGYAEVTKGPVPRLSPGVRKIAEAYYAARERMNRYRMVVWDEKWPRYREVRQGDRWRLDRLGWETMVTNRTKYSFTGPDQEFESAWAIVGVPETPVSTTLFTYEGRIAIIGYDFAPPGPKLRSYYKDRPREGWQTFNQFRFAEFAWPELRDDGLHTPSGWTVDEPPIQYQLLPPDPARPGLIRIRGTRDKQIYNFYEYWLDPKKDYLCVRYEERPSADRAEIQEITDFGKTPDSRWFPKTIKRYGRQLAGDGYGNLTYGPLLYQIRLDTSRPIDETLFAWPDGVPQPK